MESRHLHTFITVAERLNFRQAAERLYLSQPTVTAHVQSLEREVGAPLFERGGRPVRLTAAGERLLPYARRVVALEAEAVEQVRAWRARYDERLRICASIFVAASVLPPALRALTGRRPRLEVSLTTAFSHQVVEATAGGAADLGLARLPPGGAGAAGRRLWAEPVLAVAPAAWGPLPLADALAAHPLLTDNHPGYWDRLLSQLRALGLDFRPMQVRQVEVTRRLIEEGIGLSFLPESAARGPGLQVLPAAGGLELPEAGTWALWPRNRAPQAAAEELLALLAEQRRPPASARAGKRQGTS